MHPFNSGGLFKIDHYGFGVIIGLVAPLAMFGVIAGINFLLLTAGIVNHYLELHDQLLISMAANLIPVRFYFVNLKFDKSGRGVLFITFILVLIFFLMKDRILALQ